MRPSNLLSLFAISAAADIARYTTDSGIIALAIDGRAANCKAIVGVLAALKGLGGPATSFCSSYLRIGTSTVTSTVTPPASTTTVVSATTVTTTVLRHGPGKRDTFRESKATPAALRAFAAAEITSACKCLQLPTQTAAVTVTAATPINTITAFTTLTTTVQTCAAAGLHCDCANPGACCNLACSCNGPSGPVSTCL
ncbi:hypothetical protein BGZ60DRAFT_411022 [Tricladium varicosporioides]|nr:hypothetical protein BGZ60DRAFT_411022 [Hymenoscyphus varicosporioides]